MKQTPEQLRARAKAQQKYISSPKGEAARDAYEQSRRGIAARQRADVKYRQSDGGKATIAQRRANRRADRIHALALEQERQRRRPLSRQQVRVLDDGTIQPI